MKVMNFISKEIKKFANKKYILPLLFLLIFILVFMERGPFGTDQLKEMSGGIGMLDIVENCLLLFIITRFPSQHVVIISISSAVTILKLAINYGYIGMVFTLGVLTTRQTLLYKSKKQNIKGAREIL